MGIRLHRHESNRYSKHATVSMGRVEINKVGQVEIKGQRLTVCEKNLPYSRTRFSARDLAGNVIYGGFVLEDNQTVKFVDAHNFTVACFDLASWEPIFLLRGEGV